MARIIYLPLILDSIPICILLAFIFYAAGQCGRTHRTLLKAKVMAKSLMGNVSPLRVQTSLHFLTNMIDSGMSLKGHGIVKIRR